MRALHYCVTLPLLVVALSACSGKPESGEDEARTCEDHDGDGFGVGCKLGSDCDDDDQDNWTSCEECRDTDGDEVFANCDAYAIREGPDQCDSDTNNWTADGCSQCADSDADGHYSGCNRYQTITGPDNCDSNTNSWTASGCANCADNDTDGYFVGCDRYSSSSGPDQCDSDTNNWTLDGCTQCVDGDADTYFVQCDRYSTINGPDNCPHRANIDQADTGGISGRGDKCDCPTIVNWQGTQLFGRAGTDSVEGIAVDSSNCEIYLVGTVESEVLGTAVPGGVLWDSFVAKLDAHGNVLWHVLGGATFWSRAVDVVIGSDGNVYLLGSANTAMHEGVAQGDHDGFISKYDPAGSRLWTVQFGSSDWDMVHGIEIDQNDNLYVAGYTHGNVAAPIRGTNDAFVLKFDEDGNELWRSQIGGSDDEYCYGLEVDKVGDVYITGPSKSTDFLGAALLSADKWDAYLAKLSPIDGGLLKFYRGGTTDHDYGQEIASDGKGTVFWSFNTFSNTDIHLMRLNADLAPQWASDMIITSSPNARDSGYALEVDAAGDLLFAGNTLGNVYQPNAGSFDLIAGKVDGSNTPPTILWSTQTGTSYRDIVRAAALTPFGDWLVVGYTEGNFDGQTVYALDEEDGYLTLFRP